MNHFFTTQRLGALAAGLFFSAVFALNASLPAHAQTVQDAGAIYQRVLPAAGAGQTCALTSAYATQDAGSTNCLRGTVTTTPWSSSGWGTTFTQAQSYNTQSAINDNNSLTLSSAASSNAANALSIVNTTANTTYNIVTVLNSALNVAQSAQNQAINANSTANSSNSLAASAANYNYYANNADASANNYATVANNTANSANYTASVANNTSNNNVAVANSANSIAGNAYAVGAAAVNAGNAAVNTANAAYGLAQGRKAGGNIAGIGSSTCGSFRVNYSNGTSSIVSISAGCFFGGH